MDSKKPIYKSIPFWALVLLTLYSTLGFFAVPYFIKKELTAIINHDLNSQLSVDKISFNPFTITTNISGIKITDMDSTTWFSADKIHTNLHLWVSLFNRVALAKVQLYNPYYNLVTEKINDSVALKYPHIISNNTANDTDFLLDIDVIDIFAGSVDYNDQSAAKHFNLNIKKIIFNHQAFTTTDKDTKFNLSFITANNDETKLAGTFNFAKQSIDANWELNNWSTATVFNLIGDEQNSVAGIKNKSGSINANGTIQFSNINNTLPDLTINSLLLSDFQNNTESPEQLAVSIDKLQINNALFNLDTRDISIESVDAKDPEISISINADNQLIWDNGSSTVEQPATPEQIWNYQINIITASNSLLHINKLKNNSSTTNELNFTSINISNLGSKDQQKSDLELSIVADTKGQITIQSQLSTKPFELISDISFNDLNLAKWQAWIPAEVQLSMDAGWLSLQQKLILKNGEFNSTGWVKLNDLALLDNNNQKLLTIKQLDFDQNSIDSKSKIITLDNIKLNQAQGTVTIAENKQLNLNNIIQQADETSTDQSSDWIIEIKNLELIDAGTSLTDKSISPYYHTELSKVSGNVKGLSSANLSKADVKLNGVLDTYGKVNINGQINPLSEVAFTDLTIDIENLDLQNFSSYSGQFLGFPIVRGKADFELQYKLNQSLLEGINDLKFKQLKFGDKTSSKDAVNLPLKLAVGLLTDGKGIMQINLPVRGNINDPEFSYGGIVFKAFFKLITGIVTSPFKLLGKLVPGAADLDLSGIQFKTGTLELNTAEDAKLQAMQQIIQQRPAIILELTGIANNINDKKALQQQHLQQLLKLDTAPDLTDEAIIEPLKTLYINTFDQAKWSKLELQATKDEILNKLLLLENSYNELLNWQDVNEQLNM
ncbi:hypothetical protein MNBD_GAMMA01-821, partial [hydrothermal vent metagenome]